MKPTQKFLEKIYKNLIRDGAYNTNMPRWDWDGEKWIRFNPKKRNKSVNRQKKK